MKDTEKCSHHKYKEKSNLVSIATFENWGEGCIRYFKHTGELRVGNHTANGRSGYTNMVLGYTLVTWYSGNSENISPLLNKRYKWCPFICPSEWWLIMTCNLERFTVNTYIIRISRQIYWVWKWRAGKWCYSLSQSQKWLNKICNLIKFIENYTNKFIRIH